MTRAPHTAVRRRAGAAVGLALLLGLSACGSDPDPDAGSTESSPSASPSDEQSSGASTTLSVTASADPAPPDDKPFGPACKDFRTEAGVGPAEFRDEMDLGIFTVIFRDRIGDLAAVLDRADLLKHEDSTYFLPVNDAFAVLNRDQQADLLFDEEKRVQVMGRHVVEGSLAPSALAGEHPTVNGGTLQVTVDGDDVRVGLQGARVVCGNIELQNGVRVYVIDQVLIT